MPAEISNNELVIGPAIILENRGLQTETHRRMHL
jgi:hypothetical protein